jgi:hypothetical protein
MRILATHNTPHTHASHMELNTATKHIIKILNTNEAGITSAARRGVMVQHRVSALALQRAAKQAGVCLKFEHKREAGTASAAARRCAVAKRGINALTLSARAPRFFTRHKTLKAAFLGRFGQVAPDLPVFCPAFAELGAGEGGDRGSWSRA